MSEQPTVAPESTLKEFLSRSNGKSFVVDKTGKKHELIPLDLSDICEYEERMGVSLLTNIAIPKVRDIAYLLYLSLRKTGRSESQVESRDWAYKETQVLRIFDAAFAPKSADIYIEILKISGLDLGAQNPPKADQSVEKEIAAQ